MDYDDYYQLGHVVKTIGLAGGIIVFMDVTDPNHYAGLDVIFMERDGQLVPHFINKIQIEGQKGRVVLDDIGSQEDAAPLVGSPVYLPLKYLPKLEKGKFYYHDLIGLEIHSEDGLLGVVEKVYDLGPQHLVSTLVKGKEVLIPVTSAVVHTVDLKKGKVLVDLPEGLIDLYTKS